MSSLLAMIAVCFILLAVGTLWSVYWALVRPVILARISIAFEKLRSDLEWAMIEGLPEAEVRPARALALHLESSEMASSLSISVLVFFLWRYRRAVSGQEEKERAQAANIPGWLRETYRRDMALTTTAALANSPLWWPVVATVLLVAFFSNKTAQWWEDIQNAALLTRDLKFMRSAA